MVFDQATRNRLQRFVSEARTLLTKEFTRQLQEDYGITPGSGEVVAMETLSYLDNVRRETARILRVTLEHYRANSPESSTTDLLERIVREQAFTVLNRLAALRMAEAREFITESIANGYESRGFQLYLRLAGTGLGETGDAYRSYLFSLFDEFALDLRVLFDRFSPTGRLFPNEPELLKLLKLMNDPEIADLWAEDETIGWIYQYFNSKDERKKMRDESAAPRNSRELAVRNQFFTPRYVVEFLTDNTLGRIWYEMTQGETVLNDRCRYLVRRPTEIFLQEGAVAPESPEAEASLSQEELLKQPVYIPHRSLKDPREIRMLDPACGSMHFGLYAFDLYECIYEEAWDLEDRGIQFQRGAGREPLTATYASKEAFLRDVPRLIIEHNIHGVDIDSRAVQIAGLSLWLRAQKSWQAQGLKLSQRPQIQKANVVCAEPMPGEERLLNEFLEQHLADTPEQRLVGQLVRRVFEAMKLAGEAGSLLQIEQEISKDVEEARLQWLNRPKFEQLTLSILEAEPKQQELPLTVGEITDEYFWERIEGETYKALNRYAEQAENGNSYQRRLFTNDAVRGFAFIDLCRKKFDVALMNPPFGDASLPSKPYIEEVYGDTKGDVYKTFVECFQGRLVHCGMLGIISSRTGFFLGQSADWRERVLLRLYRPLLLMDLGYGVLDAMVETAAYVLRNLSGEEERNLTLSVLPSLKTIKLDKDNAFSIPTYQKHRGGLKRHQATQELERLQEEGFVNLIRGHYVRFTLDLGKIRQAGLPSSALYPLLTCFRLLADDYKEAALLEVLNNESISKYFTVSPQSFKQIPSTTFAYWVSEKIRHLFTELPSFDSDGREIKVGLQTGDDFRFVRTWWEVCPDWIVKGTLETTSQDFIAQTFGTQIWVPFAKGGKYSTFYLDLSLVVLWKKNGEGIKNFGRAVVRNEEFYFQQGLTWSDRTTSLFSARIWNKGGVFSVKGSAGFFQGNELFVSALMNSQIFNQLLSLLVGAGDAAARSYQVGVISSVPFPIKNNLLNSATETIVVNLSAHARHVWSLKRNLDTVNQTSHAFSLPALLQANASTLKERAKVLTARITKVETKMSQLQTKIDELAFDLYGINRGDRAGLNDKVSVDKSITDGNDDEEEEADNSTTTDLPFLVSELLVYALSVAFGRFDVRLSTGEREFPAEPEPFAPLPVCSPGILVGKNGLPPTAPNEVPAGYPIQIPFDGILVDDKEHPNDIVRHVRQVFKVIWGEKDSDIEQEACEILKISSLRDYFRKPAAFFNDHLTRYSKSRRQAPIYLPLSTASGSYTLWLYYHRLTDQTIYTCINDYVEPKLNRVSETVKFLRSKTTRTRDEENNLEDLQTLEDELTKFRDELLRVAKLPWKPNLNDGVQITVAPLHSLFRLSKWQKKLKETWDKLEKGDYDWAHLAYSIWTARVREKCRTDKSLAIAHGLEDLYQPPPETPKRTKRKKKE